MDDKCVPSSSVSSSPLLIGSRGDRFAALEEDDILPSPPTEFQQPFLFKPRKSKYDVPFEESQAQNDIGSHFQSLEKRFTNVVITHPQNRLPSERFKQPYSQLFAARRNSIGVETCHMFPIGSESFGRPEMFEKPAKPGLKKVEVMAPLPKTSRRASENNILYNFKTAIIPKKDLSVKVTSNDLEVKNAEKSVAQKEVVENASSDVKINPKADTVDGTAPTQSSMASFSSWLFGGKKTVSLQNKDVNALSPTSF